MNVWKSLTKIALVGTNRIKPDEEVLAFLREKNGEKERSQEEAVLEAIALAGQLQQINPVVSDFDGEISSIEAEDDGTICPPQFASYLQSILADDKIPFLPELLSHFQQKKWSFPSEFLPEILDVCVKDEVIYRLFRPHLGKRGQWLIGQNPDWYPLNEAIALKKWSLLSISQKRWSLTSFRDSNPVAALAFIHEQWDKATANEQELYLQSLHQNLSATDIPFIKKSMDSRRKRVRKEAAILLAKIPGSEALTFLVQYLPKLFVQSEKNYTWQIPESYVEDTRHLDLPLEMKKGIHTSMKGAWLGMLISLTAPITWEKIIKKKPIDTLHSLLNAGYRKAVFAGLTEAGIYYQNEEWKEALLNYLWENRTFSLPEKPLRQLLKSLTPSLFNQAALRMAKESQLLPKGGLLYQLIKYNDTPWSVPLSRLLILRFKTALRESSYNPGALNSYQIILKKGAYLIAPDAIEEVIADWPEESPEWMYWEARVYHLELELNIRRSMFGS